MPQPECEVSKSELTPGKARVRSQQIRTDPRQGRPQARPDSPNLPIPPPRIRRKGGDALISRSSLAVSNLAGTVLSVNVGTPREFEYHGRPARSAIWKTPVSGRISARGVNLAGDDQADRGAHGGPDKAVYAYAMEDVRWWEKEIGRPLERGAFGENLTTEGIDVNEALVGQRWTIGTTLLEVSEPRIPCWRLGVRMNDESFVRRFTEAMRPGAYLRILEEGDVGAGDEIRTVERPSTDLTIRDVFRIYTRDRSEAARLLEVPVMSDAWKRWASRQVEKAGHAPPKSAGEN
jgi:MOSC domain-containing protein YiiM